MLGLHRILPLPYGERPRLYVPKFDKYEFAHFHNSFSQTTVDLRVVGLLILLAVVVIFLIASLTEFLSLNYHYFGSFALFFSLLNGARITST